MTCSSLRQLLCIPCDMKERGLERDGRVTMFEKAVKQTCRQDWIYHLAQTSMKQQTTHVARHLSAPAKALVETQVRRNATSLETTGGCVDTTTPSKGAQR